MSFGSFHFRFVYKTKGWQKIRWQSNAWITLVQTDLTQILRMKFETSGSQDQSFLRLLFLVTVRVQCFA